ncbi:MAG: outer membrane beta-barrel protein [Gammaproteobacteria bacterium]
MKKTAAILILIASTTSVMSDEAVSVNTGKGFYIGVGAGSSSYLITLSESRYDYSDPDNPDFTFEASELEDSDSGRLLYAGYQFNKIIAIEAAYTKYGNFSKVIFSKEYSQAPDSIAIYANAGYTFFNGQLRPFGIGGLGYLERNQSQAYDRLGFKEELVTLHLGFGVDYYPTVLRGLGFRLSFSDDMYVESKYSYTDSTTDADSLWQNYSLFYAGVQYRF